MIEIKRNCSSSVTIRDDKITFGSISITIAGNEFEWFNKILKEEYDVPITLLKQVIGRGIVEELEDWRKYQ